MDAIGFKKRIHELFQIRTPCIWIHTQEEAFAEKYTVKTFYEMFMDSHFYSYSDGELGHEIDPVTGSNVSATEIRDLADEMMDSRNKFKWPEKLNNIKTSLILQMECPEPCLIVYRDLVRIHQDVENQRTFRDLCERGIRKDVYTPVVIISPSNTVPGMMQGFTEYVELELLSPKEIEVMATQFMRGKQSAVEEFMDTGYKEVAQAAAGLTMQQIAHAFKDSFNRFQKLEPWIMHEAKVKAIKTSSSLTFIEPEKTLDEIGGHQKLKNWIKETKACMTLEAEEFGIRPTKGSIFLGLGGTGKTAVAEALAYELGKPLIVFDLSRIMGGIVGQSEATARRAFEQINSLGGAVVLIDEADKAFKGASEEGTQDGGTIARVFGVVLQNLQNNDKNFYILTANDIEKLPAPLTRAGRLDAKWHFDFPREEDRKDIFKIYFKRAGKTVDERLINYAAKISEHFTGAEIETSVNNILKLAFLSLNKKITESVIAKGIMRTPQIFKTNRAEVDKLQDYARTHCIPFTGGDGKDITEAKTKKAQEKLEFLGTFLDDASNG